MSRNYYITTPIYYVNDVPHIGHMYTTIAADAMARFKRMCGYETYFLTGTDEHGQKIEQAAAIKGLKPKELADQVVIRYHKLWEKLGIQNNDFIRTTDARHIAAVQTIFETLLNQGDIYSGEYEGWYCTPCEAFWTETQLSDDHLCPDCGRPTVRMKEPSYFFRMSKYQDKLLKHIADNPTFIRPESRRNEVVSFIKEGLRDLSVSRVNFSWGIPVKSDERHIIYVWVDALANYISALGYLQDNDLLFKKHWPADFHLVGKDILRFHAVYWPTILLALGLELPKSVFAHGWWTVEGQKMSKTHGNVVDPFKLTDLFGIDPVRYFLLREVTFGLDGDFSYKALIHRINGDLANDFGNLATRTLGMVGRYFGGVVPTPTDFNDNDKRIHALISHTAKEYARFFDEMSLNRVLLTVWEVVGALNKYIDEMQPWSLAKDPASKGRLDTVLYVATDGLLALSNFITPFMPGTAAKLRKQLGVEEDALFKDAEELGDSCLLKSGAKLGAVSALFPRIDEKDVMAAAQGQEKPRAKESEGKLQMERIEYKDFEKVTIIAGYIEGAVNVPNSEKLLQLSINDGKGVRTVVAGIAKSYVPDELTGKTVAVVENLKPVKLMGIESRGMVLAAFDGLRHNLLILPDTVPAGTRIK